MNAPIVGPGRLVDAAEADELLGVPKAWVMRGARGASAADRRPLERRPSRERALLGADRGRLACAAAGRRVAS
jgi:hypothetical protein